MLELLVFLYFLEHAVNLVVDQVELATKDFLSFSHSILDLTYLVFQVLDWVHLSYMTQFKLFLLLLELIVVPVKHI